MSTQHTARPTESGARITLIDALRGAALFGVLLVNMLWFAGYGDLLSAEQLGALPSARIDTVVEHFVDLLVYAKSHGIFSFLFGVGFAVQMGRLEGRGLAAQSIYVRRLVGLLAIGFLHWLAIWWGDILHHYALAGFLLLLVYRWPTRWLLIVGIPLAVLAHPVQGYIQALYFDADVPGQTDAAERVAIFHGSAFWEYLRLQVREYCLPDFTDGTLVSGVLHSFSRFMIGMAVARGRYLQEAHRYVKPFLLVAAGGIAGGYVLQHDWAFTGRLEEAGWIANEDVLNAVGHLINSAGVVAMTAGYVAAFALLWQVARARSALALFAPLGQMALTNYLAQTALNYAVFFGVGLGLLGRVGVTFCVALTVVLIAIQIAVSRLWLARFRFGPAEWLWRWWTYRSRPPFRRGAEARPATAKS